VTEWIYTVLLIALLGLAVGSFLNVCIYRIPAGESIVAPPSHCPVCQTRLKAPDLIPVLSYIFLKGRCRYCQTPISPRYALVEALTAIVFIMVLYKFGVGATLVKYLFATALIITVTFIDLDHFIIPNGLVLAGIIAGLAFLPLTGEFTALNALSGILSASGFLLFLYIVSRGGMGMGDIKLAAVMGIFLGWPMSLFAVILACFTAGLVGIALLLTGLKKRKDPIPFGPFLAFATFATFMWGQDMIRLYQQIVLGY